MAGGNFLLFVAGLAAAGGVGYYLYKGGYFDSIIEALNDAIEKIKNPSNGNGGTNPCSGGKIPCKDGKCDTQSNCDKQAKCTSSQNWSPSQKKCVTRPQSNLAMAYSTPFMNDVRHRAYLLY